MNKNQNDKIQTRENDEQNINYDYITKYIRSVIPENKCKIREMENYAQENHVPIVQPEVARLITVIAKMNNPKSILEIGTAIGYSAILLADTLQPGGEIVTIERYEKMVNIARENIKECGLGDKVNVIFGDAADILKTLEGEFDFVFLDAAKGKYSEFLPNILRLLKPSGVLISDNVLYKGMIAEDSLVVRRKKTIVKRMRDYIAEISSHPSLETVVIPIGDGVAISYKQSS